MILGHVGMMFPYALLINPNKMMGFLVSGLTDFYPKPYFRFNCSRARRASLCGFDSSVTYLWLAGNGGL